MSGQSEAHRNHEAFMKLLPSLIETDPERCALMHDGEVVDIFETSDDARFAGRKRYGRGRFSTQRITTRVVDLGWFSHVLA